MTNPLRILIVDDNQLMTKTLQDIFTTKGYIVEVATSGREGLDKAQTYGFDFVLSDIKMPDVNGVDMFRAIKAETPELPVALMTAYADDTLVEAGLEHGAISVITKPLDIPKLLNFFEVLDQGRSAIVVDDESSVTKVIAVFLEAEDFVVHQMTDPEGILEVLKTEPDVVLLDLKLKDGLGLDVLRSIKEEHPNIPVIMMTGYRESLQAEVETALQDGAYMCFDKPFQLEALLEVLNQIHHQKLSRLLSGQLGM